MSELPTRIADLQAIADAATPGPWEHVQAGGGRENYVYATDARYPSLPGNESPVKVAWVTSTQQPDTARFIATFDPPTVSKLLAVVEAAQEIASDDYLEQAGPYATGIHREEAIVLTEAVAALAALHDTEGR